MEKTCLIIKPDGVGKKVAGQIISKFESEGMKLVALKMVRPGKEKLEGFYEVHKEKQFFVPFINFVISGPVIVCVWEGNDAVNRTRGIIGSTNSKEAAPGTLRNLHGTDNRRNLVHASDSPDNARREIEYFFSKEEIFEYDCNEWEKA